MNANFKSLLDSANKASNPQMDGMILMAAKCMGDHDPNLATAFCMGNWMQVSLADLARECLSYSIWQHGKESDAKRDKRKEFEATELSEDLVAEETNNKSKNWLLINNVRAVSDLKHYHQITANANVDISACVQVLKTKPIRGKLVLVFLVVARNCIFNTRFKIQTYEKQICTNKIVVLLHNCWRTHLSFHISTAPARRARRCKESCDFDTVVGLGNFMLTQ